MKELIKINNIIENNVYKKNSDLIIDIFKNDNKLKQYFINKLPTKFKNIKQIDFLLETFIEDSKNQQAQIKCFQILEGSISKQNNKFIVEFLIKHLDKYFNFKIDGHFYLGILKKLAETNDNNIQEDLFKLVKLILEKRKNEYDKLETRGEYTEEKRIIGEILNNRLDIFKKDQKKLKEIIKLIQDNFTLTEDSGDYFFYTPPNIYGLLKKYINLDYDFNNFVERFSEIKNVFIDQEVERRKKYGIKKDYDGFDAWGSGISQSGGDFSISDKNFVGNVLKPAIENQYKKQKIKTWIFIKEKIIDKKTDKNNPDFLKRAALGIIIDRLSKKRKDIRENMINIYKKLLKGKQGIPAKDDLIFYYISQSSELNLADNVIWELIEITKQRFGHDLNIFICQQIGRIARNGHEKAVDLVEELLNDEKFLNNPSISDEKFRILLSGVIDSDWQRALKIIKKLFKKQYFKKNIDRFDISIFSHQLEALVDKNEDKVFEILDNLYDSNGKLTKNQQELIARFLINLEKKGKKLLKKGYVFIYSKIKDLEKSKFTDVYSRENISKFAEILAQENLFKESLNLIKIFINDSKSPKLNDKKYKDLIKEDDFVSISTSRGWACWAMNKFIVTDGKDYIPEIVELVQEATKDKHPYVRQMAAIPLENLLKFRYAKTPKEERFMDDETAKKIENIALEMLRDKDNWHIKQVMISLVHVFSNFRALTQEDTDIVVKIFTEELNDEIRNDIIKEFIPVLIFYAEYRKEAFEGWEHSNLGDFNEKKYQNKLFEIIKEGNYDINLKISHELIHIITQDDKFDLVQYDKLKKYFEFLIKKYNNHVFEDFYRLIQEGLKLNAEVKNELYEFWRKCLEIERKEWNKKVKANAPNFWLIHYFHSEILIEVYEKIGKKEFLDILKFMTGYPELSIKQQVVDKLKEFSTNNKKVKGIFEELVKKDPVYFDDQQEWLSKKS
jgi:hypothetical protein